MFGRLNSWKLGFIEHSLSDQLLKIRTSLFGRRMPRKSPNGRRARYQFASQCRTVQCNGISYIAATQALEIVVFLLKRKEGAFCNCRPIQGQNFSQDEVYFIGSDLAVMPVMASTAYPSTQSALTIAIILSSSLECQLMVDCISSIRT